MRTRSSCWGRLTVIAIMWLLVAAAHFVSEIKMVRAVKWLVVLWHPKDIWQQINDDHLLLETETIFGEKKKKCLLQKIYMLDV